MAVGHYTCVSFSYILDMPDAFCLAAFCASGECKWSGEREV